MSYLIKWNLFCFCIVYLLWCMMQSDKKSEIKQGCDCTCEETP